MLDDFLVPVALAVSDRSSVADDFPEVFEPLALLEPVGVFVELDLLVLVGVGSLEGFEDDFLVDEADVCEDFVVEDVLVVLVEVGFLVVDVLVAFVEVFDFDFVLEAGLGSATSPLFALSGPNAMHLEKRSHSWV